MSGEGMSAFVTAIGEEFSAANLWGVVGELAPFMGAVGLVALGYYLFRRLGKGATKLKFRP